MSALARGQASSCANPVLDLFTQVNGILVDVSVLEFQIFDVSDPGKQLAPMQVYPAVAGERAPVDVSALCPAGDKLSTGHFVARWTPPVDEAIGTHEIRWFFRLTPTSPEQTFREEFEILVEVAGFSGTGYAFVSDLRAEGVAVADASDARLQQLIALASRYIERVTGRFFEPRMQALTLDGSGGRALPLGHPLPSLRPKRAPRERSAGGRDARRLSTSRAEIAIEIAPLAHPCDTTPERRSPDHLAMIGAPVQHAVAQLERRRYGSPFGRLHQPSSQVGALRFNSFSG